MSATLGGVKLTLTEKKMWTNHFQLLCIVQCRKVVLFLKRSIWIITILEQKWVFCSRKWNFVGKQFWGIHTKKCYNFCKGQISFRVYQNQNQHFLMGCHFVLFLAQPPKVASPLYYVKKRKKRKNKWLSTVLFIECHISKKAGCIIVPVGEFWVKNMWY